MIRIIHNRSIIQYFLAALGILFAAYFAWSFFPFGEWVGKHFLQDAPGGPRLLGLIAAAILGGCVLVAIFWKEYIKEDNAAYSRATGDMSFANATKWFMWFVLGMELFSVLFRSLLLNFSPVAWVMLGVGVLGMAVTYVIGKMLHVQMNRPPSVAARYMREEAGRSVFEEGHRMMRGRGIFFWKKPPAFTTEQRRRIFAGDPTPIDQVRDVKANERARETEAADRRKEQEREREKAAQDFDKSNGDFYQQMMQPAGQNGHGGKPAGFPS